MSAPLTAFINYAIHFELAFAARDFSLVAPFFCEDAEYLITGGPPFERALSGRAAIVDYYAQVTRDFDRRFARRAPVLVEGPSVSGDRVWARWGALYEVAGAPPVRLEGEFLADYSSAGIKRYEERNAPGSGARLLAWLAEHGARLAPPEG